MTLHIILVAWANTKNNHAGMFHLAKQIKETLNTKVKIYKQPVWKSRYFGPFYRLYAILLSIFIRLTSQKEDIVWLMEYLLRSSEQTYMSNILKGKVRLIGLAHMVPELISKQYNSKEIVDNIHALDKLYVFGNSLKNYFISQGVQKDITVVHHYVDTDYYTKPLREDTSNLSVICMGNMQRDYKHLYDIIYKCPTVNFIICSGKNNIKDQFECLKNVQIIGFVEEHELKELMQKADASLNVMKDTIGSNVIVTSLACGLPVIASDVGSIRDYVDDGLSGFLFNSDDEAVEIIKKLSENKSLIKSIGSNARKKAEQISLNKFISFFKTDNNII